MKKTLLCTAICVWCAGLSAAERPSNGYTVPSIQNIRYYNPKPITFTKNERIAVNQAKRQMARTVSPALGDGGAVTFRYGAATPTVVCSPLRICDIALQRGEKVRDVVIGDSARWEITPSVSGSGKTEQVHAVVKASDTGLSTNLMITTDRRVYHIDLKSARRDHMPYVTFNYPADTGSAWGSLIAHQQQQNLSSPDLGVDHSAYATSAKDLNFEYIVSGKSEPWKPTRVYDDGVKTFIDLPRGVQVGEAPVLLVRDKEGTAIANYRLKNNRYTVDGLIKEVHLIKGVGKTQERIIIRRKG